MDRTSSVRRSPAFRTLVTSVALAAALGTTVAAPAFADSTEYTYNAYASVSCDASTATMSVTATSTTWQAQGFLGPVTGIYDAGQWMRYDVFTREIGQADWTQIYTWSDWQLIRSTTVNGDLSISQPVDLGTSVVQGVAGHDYEILVQIDFWTGTDNIASLPVTYAQTLSTAPYGYGTYFLNPGYCHL